MNILGKTHKYQKESLIIEFKEFCLQDVHIDYDTIYTGKINNICRFNQDICNNIHLYFYKYLPKYISAFVNSNINGHFLIGVNDFSEITGIPFHGSKKELSLFIDNININHLLSNNFQYIVKYDIETIDTNTCYLSDNTNKILSEYSKINIKKQKILEKYKNDRIIWNRNMEEYTCKLQDFIKYKKREIDKYFTKHAPHLIHYILKTDELRNIAHLKSDPNHYLYYLMKFKEYELQKLKKMKPNIPSTPKIIHGPEYLYNQLTHMRMKLLNNNSELRYFLIHIKIIPVNTCKNQKLYYLNPLTNTWDLKYRTIDVKNGPKCE